MKLPEHWDSQVARIARMSASRFRGGQYFTYHERAELAMDGIIEHIAGHGWPATEKTLFRAADNAIRREEREVTKHLMRGSYWVDPRGDTDSLAEAVTDRVAVWQIAWLFTDRQWSAVWAMSEVKKFGGTKHDAAALLGWTLNAFGLQLSLARKRARAAWIAPGETPPGLWALDYRSRTQDRPMRGRLRRREHNRRAAA